VFSKTASAGEQEHLNNSRDISDISGHRGMF
jgi:hypothetical protein